MSHQRKTIVVQGALASLAADYAPDNFSRFLDRIAARHRAFADACLPADLDEAQIGMLVETLTRGSEPTGGDQDNAVDRVARRLRDGAVLAELARRWERHPSPLLQRAAALTETEAMALLDRADREKARLRSANDSSDQRKNEESDNE